MGPQWPQVEAPRKPRTHYALELEDEENGYFAAASGGANNTKHGAKEIEHGEANGHASPKLKANPNRRADLAR